MTRDERDFNRRMGQKISRKRKAAGVKQLSLALALGMHQSHVSRIERGISGLSLFDYRRIRKALDCEELLENLPKDFTK